MSMSTHIVGFKPVNEKWAKMKAIWDACHDAEIPIPDEVSEYFGDESPDPAGVRVELKGQCVKEWTENSSTGFEVDVDQLPKHVKVIRFYNSW